LIEQRKNSGKDIRDDDIDSKEEEKRNDNNEFNELNNLIQKLRILNE
jgi:hypothetical protein